MANSSPQLQNVLAFQRGCVMCKGAKTLLTRLPFIIGDYDEQPRRNLVPTAISLRLWADGWGIRLQLGGKGHSEAGL